jgi:hypothetical protein
MKAKGDPTRFVTAVAKWSKYGPNFKFLEVGVFGSFPLPSWVSGSEVGVIVAFSSSSFYAA